MIILDLKNFRCMTLKLSLNRIIKYSHEKSRTSLSLLNRSKNKPAFLKYLKELLLNRDLTLFEISKIFMKVNSVYKQASIERQSIRKKAAGSRRTDSQILIDNPGYE